MVELMIELMVEDLLQHIFSYGDYDDYFILTKTCKYFKFLIQTYTDYPDFIQTMTCTNIPFKSKFDLFEFCCLNNYLKFAKYFYQKLHLANYWKFYPVFVKVCHKDYIEIAKWLHSKVNFSAKSLSCVIRCSDLFSAEMFNWLRNTIFDHNRKN